MLDQSLSSVNPVSAGTESASESGKRAFAFPPFNAPQTSPTNMTHFRIAHPHLFLKHPYKSDASMLKTPLTSKLINRNLLLPNSNFPIAHYYTRKTDR